MRFMLNIDKLFQYISKTEGEIYEGMFEFVDDDNLKSMDIEDEEIIFKNIVKQIEEQNLYSKVELYREDYEEVVDSIVLWYRNDNEKVKYVKKYDDDIAKNIKSEIIQSIESDDLKIEFLDQIQDEYDKSKIILSLKSDDKKLNFLKQIQNEGYKSEIISTLKSDNLKIEFLDQIQNKYSKISIICSIVSESKRVKQLGKIKDENCRIKIISELKSDDSKIEALEYIQNEDSKIEIIVSLNSDDRKIGLFPTLSEKDIYNISKSLKSEDKIVEALKYNKDEKHRYELSEKLTLDDKKIEAFDYLQDEENKFRLIGNLKSKDKKMEILENRFDLSEDEKSVIDNFFKKDRESLMEENTPNEYKKLLLDPKVTIGIELEAEGKNSRIIKTLDEILDWKIKADGSLEEGVEITSNILRSGDEKSIYTVANLMQKSGLETSTRCGGHIHIGADYLDTKEAWDTFYYDMLLNSEKIMYMISNKKGELPREGIKTYAIAQSGEFEKALESGEIDISINTVDEIKSNIKSFQESKIGAKYAGINFSNLGETDKNTIEFRLPNGTIEPDEIIHNVNLCGRFVQISKEIGDIKIRAKNGEEISEDDRKKLELLNGLTSKIPDEEKLDVFLDLLFDDDETKQVYIERYNSSKELVEQREAEGKEHPLKNMNYIKDGFKKEDYKRMCEENIEEIALSEKRATDIIEQYVEEQEVSEVGEINYE